MESVRNTGVSVLLAPAALVVICKILSVQIVLKVANKGEQILSLQTLNIPEAHSIGRRLGGDAQEWDFNVHCCSSNYFENFNPDFITSALSLHRPPAFNHPFALLGFDSRCLWYCSFLEVNKSVLANGCSIFLYSILCPKGLSCHSWMHPNTR